MVLPYESMNDLRYLSFPFSGTKTSAFALQQPEFLNFYVQSTLATKVQPLKSNAGATILG